MAEINDVNLPDLLQVTLQQRLPLLTEPHNPAIRLFNGFTEGFPTLTVDLYGETVLLAVTKLIGREAAEILRSACALYAQALPWVECIIGKQRSTENPSLKQGEIIFGRNPAKSINENGVVYSLDLLINQDASFYIDTRHLRTWLKQNSADKAVLNTFAYTGSLGVAALAGGAKQVLQIDRNPRFLDLAARSVELNHFDPKKMKCSAVDFFVAVGQLKQRKESFDLIILDPPFFSITERGRVDQVTESIRLINKVRPLVKDGGYLVVVNNALFLSGRDFMQSLLDLEKDGFVKFKEQIDVPQDFTGYADTRVGNLPVDPAPFNHSTKIAVLSVKKR
jgi:23S rRNA (cytosine1962-C5)-methyltransferase